MRANKTLALVITSAYLLVVAAAYAFVAPAFIRSYSETSESSVSASVSEPVAEEAKSDSCEHDWVNGICQKCGETCNHDYADGVCTICGMTCRHSWKKGVCKVCGLKCEHKSHSPHTFKCSVCGETVPHHLVNTVCSRCGYEPEFYNDMLPYEYYYPCVERGSICTIQYPAYRRYAGHATAVMKTAQLYLPYGYDKDDKDTHYNVVIAMHGGNNDENSVMTKSVRVNGYTAVYRDAYDWVIYNKLCEPFIVFAPNASEISTGDWADDGSRELGRELRETILPMLADNFNTYAKDGSLESLREARQHFGMFGGSNGSLYTIAAGFLRNFDIMGNFAAISGNNEAVQVAEMLNKDEYRDLPVYCFFAGAGTDDYLQGSTLRGYNTIVESRDDLVDGKNCFHVDVACGHDWKLFHTDTYNALQVMFQGVEGDAAA